MSEHQVILYDGVCGLCNRLVGFLIKRDRRDRLRFASLQSTLGKAIVSRHGGNPESLDTVYLVSDLGTDKERVRVRAKAIFYGVDELGGAWRIPALLRFVPAFLLNPGYLLVAKIRYRLWGKLEACSLPSPETQAKFLES